jgi:Uma2 family endonuclease
MAERTKLGMPLAEFIEKFDEQRFEMIQGEIIEMSPTKKRHSSISKRIYDQILFHSVKEKLGQVYFETTYILNDVSDWVADSRVPDVSFYEQSRFEEYEANYPNQEEKPFVLVPDLVVEVISPTDKFSHIEKKIAAYRSDGVKLLWIVDPQNETITVYEAGTETPIKLKKGDKLTGGEVLKGFEMKVIEVLG